jgi:hypothetical protein
MKQSPMTAHDLLMNAMHDVDELLGKGAVEKYPQIVAAHLNAAAIDGAAALIAQEIRLGLDTIADAVGEVEIAGDLRGGLDNLAEAAQNIAAMIDLISGKMGRA